MCTNVQIKKLSVNTFFTLVRFWCNKEQCGASCVFIMEPKHYSLTDSTSVSLTAIFKPRMCRSGDPHYSPRNIVCRCCFLSLFVYFQQFLPILDNFGFHPSLNIKCLYCSAIKALQPLYIFQCDKWGKDRTRTVIALAKRPKSKMRGGG